MFAQGGQKYSVAGNTLSNGDWLGSINAVPITIKVNNTERGVFTATGFDVYGNFHSTFASVDSITSSWRVIVNDLLTTKKINAEQYFQNDTLVDLLGMQSAVGSLASAQAGQQSAVDSLQFTVGNLSDSDSDLRSQISNLIGTVDTVVLNTVQVNNITTQSISSDTIYLTGPIVADTVKIPNELKLGDHSLYISGLKTGDPTSANRIYSREDDLLFQSVAGNNFNTIINSGNSGNVGIGTISPAEKLSVEGNVLVSGNITSAGTISASNISITNDFITNKIITNRITTTDSGLFLGDSSIFFQTTSNRIFGTFSNTSSYKGLGLGVATFARGTRSTAIGKNVSVSLNADNAIIVGSGISLAETNALVNNTIYNYNVVRY